MERLAQRLAALEVQNSSGGFERDLRVILMQISRAEEKILRIRRTSSRWTRPDLLAQATGSP